MRILSVLLLLSGLATSSFGAFITNGHFDIGGTIYVTNFQTAAQVTPGGTCPASAGGMQCIFWTDPTGASIGKVDISNSGLPNGDIPLALSGNDAGNISPLQNPPQGVGGAGFANTLFLSFNNAGITTQLLINFIDPGIYSSLLCGGIPISGTSCTLPGSLFSFVNNPPPGPGNACGATGCQATATWVVEGTTAGNPGPFQEHWTANFSAQFPQGTPYQTVFNQLQANGFVSNTFSATVTLAPIVPEPDTTILMGVGLLMVGLVFRRWKKA